MVADPSRTTTDTIPFVDLVAQYESIADEIDEAFHSVTRSAEYILGKTRGGLRDEVRDVRGD